jgi:hypothetical protein
MKLDRYKSIGILSLIIVISGIFGAPSYNSENNPTKFYILLRLLVIP